jgi:hypothetical protein
MSVRHLLAAAAAAVLGVFVLATPAAAQVLAQPSVSGWTPGRIWGTAAALLALVGVVIGGLALARSIRRIGNGGRRGAIVALVAGLTAMVGGVLNLAVADGGPGTGNGVIGGAAALVLGLIAAVLGGLVVARSRRTFSRADQLTG